MLLKPGKYVTIRLSAKQTTFFRKMMKNLIYILFLLFTISIVSQTVVTGKVITNKKMPLQGASVYLNKTSIGTITDENGEFTLNVPNGVHELIMSFIGFKTINTKLVTNDYDKPLLIKTYPKSNLLNEVVVSNEKPKKVSNWQRKRYLKRFEQYFLGTTRLSGKCSIENPEVLSFSESTDKKILVAEATAPLKILNKGLGYRISYELNSFLLTDKNIQYSGYSKYSALKGSERKIRKWNKERLRAYNGSLQHFLNALLGKRTKKEGFLINEIEEIIPTEEEKEWANAILRKYKQRGRKINISREVGNPVNELDSAIVYLGTNDAHKRYKKIKERLYYGNLIVEDKDIRALKFNNILEVIYFNEPEEYNYRFENKRLDKQVSMLRLTSKYAIITPNNRLSNPLDVYFQGYWAYEQFADTLPIDYQPPEPEKE